MESIESLGPEIFRKKFETFHKLKKELGEKGAWEKMFEGYPERQKQTMGPFIENSTLAQGFSKAIPIYKQIGMEMEIVDISNRGMDAVLEIQRVCPALSFYRDYGFDKPCELICEMDGRASHQAFPDLKGEILCTQAEGACACIFKYERKKR